MDNLSIYNKVKAVPVEAQKKIGGGRLSGMTDINPMWRLKTLTEQFGICGIGWKYEIAEKKLEQGSNGEIAAFVDINLYIKVDGEWSAAIPGTGGSSFVAKEKNGLYTSDECFKMALTDAISVSCKALGFGADVYWDKDRTKYTESGNNQSEGHTEGQTENHSNLTEKQIKRLFAIANSKGKNAEHVKKSILNSYNLANAEDMTKEQYNKVVAYYEAL